MPKVKFRCAKCKRNFKMAAHLGRHMKSIHGEAGSQVSKTTKKRKVGRPVGRPAGRPVGRPVGRPAGRMTSFQTGGEGVSRLLSEMAMYHSNLTDQRSSLDREIDAVASAMQLLGSGAPTSVSRKAGPKAKRKVGRPKGSGRTAATPGPRSGSRSGPRPGSLKDFIVRVLGQNSKPLSPQDIGNRVVKAGFKTKAKDLTKAVSNVLPTIKKVKRVGFGQYQLPQ